MILDKPELDRDGSFITVSRINDALDPFTRFGLRKQAANFPTL